VHSNQGKESLKFYGTAVGESQWLGHHDLEARHQQQFQEPKQCLHLVIKNTIL